MFVQIKESLSEVRERTVFTASDSLKNISVHVAAWVLYVGLAFVSCTAVYFMSTYNLQIVEVALHARDLESEAFFLLLPILVSFINMVVPLLYGLISRIEQYDNLRAKLYADLARDVLLKMSILGILCYYWLTDVPSKLPCWESFVGQDVYRLAIADFMFSVLGCVFGEYLGRIGVYFSPLLPIVQIVKLFIIFYMKKVSIRLICRLSTRPGLATEMKTAFVFLLFFPSYIGSLFIVGYIVWSLKPSAHCGPFQGLNTAIDALSSWMEAAVVSPHKLVIQGKLLLLLLSSIMLIILYFLWQVVQDRKWLISSLREHIVNEGKDKAFLLVRLRRVQGGSGRPQVRFLDEEVKAVRKSTFKVAPSMVRVKPSRPAAERTRWASAQALTPVQPPPAASLKPPQQPRQKPDQRDKATRRGPSSAGKDQSSLNPEAGSAGTGRVSRVECWVEDERPDQPSPSPAPQLAWGSTSRTPPRFPRLEPITPRDAQAPLPGTVPESPKHSKRTHKPKH
ncbi:transmembrane channel-like protein 5 isoform X2 [Clupea harengus]|uniref:Transmembrane channel-like protein n=1 Tax=Clupea harengus TaxID=7950 RepID=A0A6P8FCL1_CLUHA|nr:transmembrane channel-like protein 5 isoform X2 [Clupea harengus]